MHEHNFCLYNFLADLSFLLETGVCDIVSEAVVGDGASDVGDGCVQGVVVDMSLGWG